MWSLLILLARDHAGTYRLPGHRVGYATYSSNSSCWAAQHVPEAAGATFSEVVFYV